MVGNYSIGQTDWEMGEDRPKPDCRVCHNAKYATILVKTKWDEDSYICVECLLENAKSKPSVDSTYSVAHLDYSEGCCGFFNVWKSGELVCNECGESLNKTLLSFEPKKILKTLLRIIHIDGKIDCNEYQGKDFENLFIEITKTLTKKD